MAEKKEQKKIFPKYKQKKQCPKCGSGMADHIDRMSCGKCGYTEFKSAKSKKV
ncbi:MAG: 30S ribosomal protein S27ae [Candidatus Micrarchaeaceae archaeon]